MYQLLYVRGLSRLDTPTFSTINEQNDWFSNRVVKTIDGYYPPYYNNVVTLYDDDLNIFNNINYFRLQYKEKWYYYFIDDIRYISDEAYELYITLDVIQTFMFNIEFEKSHITRKCIKRWVQDGFGNWLVNRDFIRENFSTETKQLKVFNEFSSWIPFLIITSSEPLSSDSITLRIQIEHRVTLNTGLYYYCIPLFKANFPIASSKLDVYYNDTLLGAVDNVSNILSYFMDKPSVQSIIYYNNMSLMNLFGMQYIENENRLNVGMGVNVREFGTYKAIELTNYTLFTSEQIFQSIINIERNDSIKRLRNKKFTPQIYDENYVEIYVGEYCKQTGISLSKVKNLKMLKLYYYCDIVNSSRIYYISDDSKNGDIYNNGISINSIENLTVINDAWKQYQANYFGTLTRGKALQEQQAIYSAITNATSGSINAVGNLLSGNVGGAMGDVTGTAFILPNTLEKLYSIDEQLKVVKENMEYRPNTIRNGNDLLGDIALKSIVPIWYAYVVPDLEAVATKMELYGYKVNEYTNNNLLMTNTRYYFDIIASDETIFNCRDYMLTESEKQFIKNRLSNGLRLWHVERCTNNEMFNDIDYDNVEIK